MKMVDEANPKLSWKNQGMVLGLKQDVLSNPARREEMQDWHGLILQGTEHV